MRIVLFLAMAVLMGCAVPSGSTSAQLVVQPAPRVTIDEPWVRRKIDELMEGSKFDDLVITKGLVKDVRVLIPIEYDALGESDPVWLAQFSGTLYYSMDDAAKTDRFTSAKAFTSGKMAFSAADGTRLSVMLTP